MSGISSLLVTDFDVLSFLPVVYLYIYIFILHMPWCIFRVASLSLNIDQLNILGGS